MKKIFLTLTLVGSTIAFAQTLQSEDFNTLNIGNVGTDITFTNPGQGNFVTFASNGTAPTTSDNAGLSNFQIIAAGNNNTKGLQIVSSNGDKGSRGMLKVGLDASWAGRTAGNDIIELEYDFFTGPITDSRSQIGMRILGTQLVGSTPTLRSLAGFVYTTNSRLLQRIAYTVNGGTPNTWLYNFDQTPLILDPNTWYTIGCSYNSTTGEVTWRTSSSTPASTLPNAAWIAGMTPNQVRIIQAVVVANPSATPPAPANVETSTIVFDNYIARAVATSNLLNVEDFTVKGATIAIYPNPTTDLLNIKMDGSNAINVIQIVDLNGRQILSRTFDTVSEAQIDVNDLSAGMYLINITSGDQSVTKKFLKQ